MPPRELLGRFVSPGDCEAIADWLRLGAGFPSAEFPLSELEGLRAGVNPANAGFTLRPRSGQGQAAPRLGLSLDMLCYGGLVASRAPGPEAATALARLNALRELRQRCPDAVVFAFGTIMRLGRTVVCSADLREHALLRAYSQLLDRVERLGEAEARGELEQTQRELGRDRLAEYLAVRRRNHAVNRAAVELVAEGVLDHLILAQEDSAPVGIHLPEQLALSALIEEHRVGDRVAITCGSDEMTMLLLARHVTAAAGLTPGIAVDLAAESGGDVVAAFESRPLREVILDHIHLSGGRPATPADCDALLFVHTPIGAQPDLAEAPPPAQAPALARQAESVADRVEAAGSAGRLVGLADVAYCNGADPELIGALERGSALARLTAFAGWNTAANTLGTVISQLCLMAAAPRGRVNQSAVRGFLATRLVEDYGYQSVARREAIQRATTIGADPFCLGENRAELEGFVTAQLAPLAHRYLSLLIPGWKAEEGSLRFSLPWGRLFEVEAELGLGSAEIAAGPKNLR
jgi:hypothetical protein